MQQLITLSSENSEIGVCPRWPYRTVVVSPAALNALKHAQHLLGSDLKLVLTRGYEDSGWFIRTIHRICRMSGAMLFRIVYPKRSSECKEIFSPNGHDKDGTHVDVSVAMNGTVRQLLPYGVFTSQRQALQSRTQEGLWLQKVYGALQQSGFKVHPNLTESLQIHCDLVQS